MTTAERERERERERESELTWACADDATANEGQRRTTSSRRRRRFVATKENFSNYRRRDATDSDCAAAAFPRRKGGSKEKGKFNLNQIFSGVCPSARARPSSVGLSVTLAVLGGRKYGGFARARANTTTIHTHHKCSKNLGPRCRLLMAATAAFAATTQHDRPSLHNRFDVTYRSPPWFSRFCNLAREARLEMDEFSGRICICND